MAFAFSSAIDKNQINSRLKKIIKDVKSISLPALSKAGLNSDLVQTFLYYDNSGKRDPLLTPIIASAALSAEHNSAGSGSLFLEIFLSQILDDINNESFGKDRNQVWKKINEVLKDNISNCTKSELLYYFKTHLDDTTFNIISSVIDKATVSDKINVKKGISNKTSITRSSGYKFSGLNINSEFFKNSPWKRTNCRVVLIDGVIESVSEIYRLLEQQSENKTPCIIFCIDALEDVKNTIIHNFQRGSLDVVIVPIPVDHLHINTLVDLGVITQTTPVCAAKGETISMVADHHKNILKHVTVEKGTVIIENPEADEKALRHLENLEKRLSADPTISLILQPRIDTLTCKSLYISVGKDDLNKQPLIIEKLDSILRGLPNIISSGFIEKKSIKTFPNEITSLLFKDDMDIEPISKIIQAINIFDSVRNSIIEAEAGIQYTNSKEE